MKAIRTILAIALLSAAVAPCRADIVDEAIELYDSGNYTAAQEMLEPALSTLKGARLGLANVYLGRLAFLDYDFPKATRLYSSGAAALRKAKKEVPDELETWETQLTGAKNFLERVEKIEIIDSVSVPAESFFKAIRLHPSAGHLESPKDIPFKEGRDLASMAFSNENRDFMMWAQPDSAGVTRIVESIKLVDGSWHEPEFTPEELNMGGDADYPFMMSDGTTLYYASDSEESIGGLDIFVASRDAATGEYLQPQNIGMPYNSPFDDYMLCIDEMNGVGWWATDRNQLGDRVTLYVFIPNEVRRNIDPDNEEIVDFARISDISITQEPDKDYSPLLKEIANTKPDEKKKAADFYFPVGGGKVYTTLSDFRNSSAKALMKQYLAAEDSHRKNLEKLSSLRKKYHKGRYGSLAGEIQRLETITIREASELKKLRSEILKTERKSAR